MSKQQDADLILKLYDLRREAVMRDARTGFSHLTQRAYKMSLKRL